MVKAMSDIQQQKNNRNKMLWGAIEVHVMIRNVMGSLIISTIRTELFQLLNFQTCNLERCTPCNYKIQITRDQF